MATTSINQNQKYFRLLMDAKWDDSGRTTNIQLAKARMTNPDTLNPVITHLQGKDSKLFPLLFLTEGQKGGVDYKEIEDVEYNWPVFGRMRTTDAIAGHDYADNDRVGDGGAPIYLIMKTAWLKNQHTVTTPQGFRMRVSGKPEPTALGFKYEFDLIRDSNNRYIPASELAPNTLLSMSSGANVSESYSFGNESNKRFPGKVKNQIGILRKSYEIGGNVSNRQVAFEFNVKGKTTRYYTPFEEYENEMKFKQAIEENLWDSTYNRSADGKIMNYDKDTGLPIPFGAGLIQQIPNVDSYGQLTAKTLDRTVGDIMFGASDIDNMNVVLFTGTGGKREFSRAMKEDANNWNLLDGALARTITGGPRGLTYGSYFTTYRHIDGHTITVRELPMLDHGGRAQNAPKHPVDGLPMTSYEMHFVDMTKYDGINNVQLVSQKGRSMIRGIEQGLTLIKNSSYGDYKGNTMDINLATSQDKTSIHFLKTCGVALRRNTHCFSLYCSLS